MITNDQKELLRQLMITKNIDFSEINSIINSIDSEEKYFKLLKQYRA
jgi:hypothetical protein